MSVNFLELEQTAAYWKKLHNPLQKYDPRNFIYYRDPRYGQETAPPHLGVMMTDRTWGRGFYDGAYRLFGGHGRSLDTLNAIGGQNFPPIVMTPETPGTPGTPGGTPGTPGTPEILHETGRQAVAAYALHAAEYVHSTEADAGVRAAIEIGAIANDIFDAFEQAHSNAETAINRAFKAANNSEQSTYDDVLAELQDLGDEDPPNEIALRIARQLETIHRTPDTAYANGQAAARDVRRLSNFHVASAVQRYTAAAIRIQPPNQTLIDFAARATDEVISAANSTGLAREQLRNVAPILFAVRDVAGAPTATAETVNDWMTTALNNNNLAEDNPIREDFEKAAAQFMADNAATVGNAGSGRAFYEHILNAGEKIIQKGARWPYYHPQIGRIVAHTAIEHIKNPPPRTPIASMDDGSDTPQEQFVSFSGIGTSSGRLEVPQRPPHGSTTSEHPGVADIENTCAAVDIATKDAVKEIAQEIVRRAGQDQVVERIKRARANERRLSRWNSKLYTRLPGADALTALAVASNAALEPGANVQSVLSALAAICGPNAPLATYEGRIAFEAAMAAAEVVDPVGRDNIASTRLIIAAIAKVTPKRNLPAEAAIVAAARDAEADLQSLIRESIQRQRAQSRPLSRTGTLRAGRRVSRRESMGVTIRLATEVDVMRHIEKLTAMFEMTPTLQQMVNNARGLFQDPDQPPTRPQLAVAFGAPGQRAGRGDDQGDDLDDDLDAAQDADPDADQAIVQADSGVIQAEVDRVARASRLGADLGQKIDAINVKPARVLNQPVDMFVLDKMSNKVGSFFGGISDNVSGFLRQHIRQPAPAEQPQLAETTPFVGLRADEIRDRKLKSLQDFYIRTELERPINEEALLLAEQEKARLRELNPGHSSWMFPHFTGIGGAEKDERDFTMLRQHISDAIGFDVGVMMERYLIKGKAYGAAGLFGNFLSLLPSIAVTKTEALGASDNKFLDSSAQAAQWFALGLQGILAFYAVPKVQSWLQQPMLQYLQIGYSGGTAERDIDLRSTKYVVEPAALKERDYVDYSTAKEEAEYYDKKLDISTPDKAMFKELDRIARDMESAIADLERFQNDARAVNPRRDGARNLEEAEKECGRIRREAEQWLTIFQKRLSMCDTNNLGQFMQSFGRCLRNLELTFAPVYDWLQTEKINKIKEGVANGTLPSDTVVPVRDPAFVHKTHMISLAILVPITMAFGAIDERLKWGEALNGVSLHTDFRSDDAIKHGYTADHRDPDKRLQANKGHFNLDLVRKSYAGPYQLRYKMLDAMTDHEIRDKQDEYARLLAIGPQAGIDKRVGNTVGKWTWLDSRKIKGVDIRRYEILTAKRIGMAPTGNVADQLGAADAPAEGSIREFRGRDWANVRDPALTWAMQAWLTLEKANHAPLDTAHAAVLKDLKSKAGMSVMTPEMWTKYDRYCNRPEVLDAVNAGGDIRTALSERIPNPAHRIEALDLHRMAQYSLRPWQFKRLDILQQAAKWTPAAKLEADLIYMSQWQGPYPMNPQKLDRYKELLRKEIISDTDTRYPARAEGLTQIEKIELRKIEDNIRTHYSVANAKKFRDLASQVATGWTKGEAKEFLHLHARINPAKQAWATHSRDNDLANPLEGIEQDMASLELDKLTRLYDWSQLTPQSKRNIETSWGDPGFFRGTGKDIQFAWKSGRTRQTQAKFMGPEDAQRHGALNQGPIMIGGSMPLLTSRIYGVAAAHRHEVPVDWRIGITVGVGVLSLIGNFNFGNLVNDKQVKFGVLGRYDYEDPHKAPPAAYSTARLSYSAMTVQFKTLRDFNFGSKAQAIRVRRLMRDLAERRRNAMTDERLRQEETSNFVAQASGGNDDDDQGNIVNPRRGGGRRGRKDKRPERRRGVDTPEDIKILEPGEERTESPHGAEEPMVDLPGEASLSKALRSELEQLTEERRELEKSIEEQHGMPAGPGQLLSDEDFLAKRNLDLKIAELQQDIADLEKIDPVPMQDPMVVAQRSWGGIANEFDDVLGDVSERMFFNYRLKQDPMNLTINEHDGTFEHTLPEEKLRLLREQFKLDHAEAIMQETRRQLYFRDLAHQGLAILSHENPETGEPQAEITWALKDPEAVDRKEYLDREFNEQYEAAWTAKKVEGFLMSVISDEKNLDLATMDYAARTELFNDKEAVDRALGKLAEMGMKVREQAAPVAVAEQKRVQEMKIELATLEAERDQDVPIPPLQVGQFPDKEWERKRKAQQDRDKRIDELKEAISGSNAELSIEEGNDLTRSSARNDLELSDWSLADELIDKMNQNQIAAAKQDVLEFVTSYKEAHQGATWSLTDTEEKEAMAKSAAEFVAKVKTERGLDDIHAQADKIDLAESPKTSEQMISDILVATILEWRTNVETRTDHDQITDNQAATQTSDELKHEQRRHERRLKAQKKALEKERIDKLTETVQKSAKAYEGNLDKPEYIRAKMAWGEKFGRGTDSPAFTEDHFVHHLEELKAKDADIKLDETTIKAIFQEYLKDAPRQSRERSASIDSTMSDQTPVVDPMEAERAPGQSRERSASISSTMSDQTIVVDPMDAEPAPRQGRERSASISSTTSDQTIAVDPTEEAALDPNASESDKKIAVQKLTEQQFPKIKLVTVLPLKDVQELSKALADVLSSVAIVGKNEKTGELVIRIDPKLLGQDGNNAIVTTIPGTDATRNLPLSDKYVQLTERKHEQGQQKTTGQEITTGRGRH